MTIASAGECEEAPVDWWIQVLETTTPVWSALVGAAAAIAGIWIAAHLAAKKERRDKVATDIAAFIESCSDAVSGIAAGQMPGPLQAKTAVASTRLVLSLGKNDLPIRLITATTANELAGDASRSTLQAAQNALQDWHLGLVSADKAVEQYQTERVALVKKYGKDPIGAVARRTAGRAEQRDQGRAEGQDEGPAPAGPSE